MQQSTNKSADPFAFSIENLTEPCPNFTTYGHRERFCHFVADHLFAGFCRSSIIENSQLMKWSKVVDRGVSEKHVDHIKWSMSEHSVMKFTVESAIPIPMHQAWIENELSSLLKNPTSDFNDLPLLVLTLEGQTALHQSLFSPFGGNHRQLARKRLDEELDSEIALMKKKKVESLTEVENELIKSKELLRSELKEWSFLIYNKDKFDKMHRTVQDAVAIHLSRNRYLPIMPEGEDEQLHIDIRRLSYAFRLDLEKRWSEVKPLELANFHRCLSNIFDSFRTVDKSKSVQSALRHLYMNEDLMLFLTKLSMLGPHFRNSAVFKRKKVSTQVNKTYGGVRPFHFVLGLLYRTYRYLKMLAVILGDVLECTLRLFSTAPFVSDAELQKVISRTDDVEDEDFKRLERLFWDLPCEESSIRFDLMTETLLVNIDTAFKDFVVPKQPGFLSVSEDYEEQMKQYNAKVRGLLVQHTKGLGPDDPPWIVTRFDFLCHLSSRKYHFQYPLMTKRLIDAVVDLYESVSPVFSEIFYMIDPLSQYTRLFGQRHPSIISPDQSLSVFRSIKSDPIMKDTVDCSDAALMVFRYLTSIASLLLVHDNETVAKFVEQHPRPDAKRLKAVFGSQIETLTANELFSLNVDIEPIPFSQQSNATGFVEFDNLFEQEQYNQREILVSLRSIASVVFQKLSSRAYARTVDERLHENPGIRVIGATSHRFSSKTVPPSASHLEKNHLKLCLGAVYESVRANVLGPRLLEKAEYLAQVRSNIAAILSTYTSVPYRFADELNKDPDVTFVNQLSDPEEVETIKTVASRRKKNAQFYEMIDPFVKYIMSYEGFFYTSEEDNKKYWDPSCRSIVNVLLENVGRNVKRKISSDVDSEFENDEEEDEDEDDRSQLVQHYSKELDAIGLEENGGPGISVGVLVSKDQEKEISSSFGSDGFDIEMEWHGISKDADVGSLVSAGVNRGEDDPMDEEEENNADKRVMNSNEEVEEEKEEEENGASKKPVKPADEEEKEGNNTAGEVAKSIEEEKDEVDDTAEGAAKLNEEEEEEEEEEDGEKRKGMKQDKLRFNDKEEGISSDKEKDIGSDKEKEGTKEKKRTLTTENTNENASARYRSRETEVKRRKLNDDGSEDEADDDDGSDDETDEESDDESDDEVQRRTHKQVLNHQKVVSTSDEEEEEEHIKPDSDCTPFSQRSNTSHAAKRKNGLDLGLDLDLGNRDQLEYSRLKRRCTGKKNQGDDEKLVPAPYV